MNRKMPFRQIRGCAAVLLILVAVFSGMYAISRLFEEGFRLVINPLTQLDTGWYRMEDGREIPIQPDETLSFGEDGTLTLYRKGLTSSTITTRGGVYRIVMELDGQEIYRFDDSAFPFNAQMRSKVHCDASLRIMHSDSVLAITYYRNDGPTFKVPPVYVGSSGEVVLAHIRADLFTLLLICLMLLCAIGAAVVSIFMAFNRMLDIRFLDVMMFLLLCSVWCFCDSALARYISRMSPGVEGISFYAFMTLGIPFVRLISNTGSLRQRKSLQIVTLCFFLNLIGQTVLWAVGAAEFIEMLPATHVVLAASIIVSVVEMYLEYLRGKDRQIIIVILAFATVCIAGVLALALYWVFAISNYEIIFEVGVLAFILLLMSYLCVKMVENLRFKAESEIYERLSREDAMTGLQNRRGFDEYIQKLTDTRQWDTDAMLLFMDINNLKAVNDRYGHKAGDEMIIGAAQCLKKVFGSEAACFRMGGDEFCVIVPGTASQMTDWLTELEKTVESYNQSHRIRVSLAVGGSMLLDESGQPKSISDWKQQADQQMYKNKKKMKQKKL